jgi:hypothetical protein
MLFILLPASRLLHRFIYSLFDMFDRGNVMDEAAEGMVENTWKMMAAGKGMWNLFGKMYDGFKDARSKTGGNPWNGGDGGGGFSPSPHSPDRLAGVLQNSQVNGISHAGAGINNSFGQLENGVERNEGLALNGNLQNETPFQQYGHLPESQYLHEAQMLTQSLAENRQMANGQLMATGTDNRDISFSPFNMESGSKDNAVFIPFRNRSSSQGQAGFRQRNPIPSSSVGPRASLSTARPGGVSPLQVSRAVSAPPKVVPINRPAGSTTNSVPANISQIRPKTSSTNLTNTSTFNTARPEPVRIQPVKSTIGSESKVSQGNIDRPSIHSTTPYSGINSNIGRSSNTSQLSTSSLSTLSSPNIQSRSDLQSDNSKDTPIFNDNTLNIKINPPVERNEG